jgi:1,4-dihydroxy-2-naphthoate polyprenyltransferase
MKLSSFLKLVEIQTKVASVIPLLLGTSYALYRFNTFNVKNFILMLISLLAIDMATTAINNYYDYKKAVRTHGFGYESHNAIVRDKLKESSVIAAILMLLGIASGFGFVLFLNTNYIVLILGAISFLVGVLYSFGPVPISRTPFGELFSGGFMGLIITFIAVYIHVFDRGVISLLYQNGTLNIGVNVIDIVYIVLVCIPAISGIANIMLANNICDIEEDLENRRYTLPIYVGRENALRLFKVLYYIVYIDLIILVILRGIPLISLLVLVTFIPVSKNIKAFYEKQTKKDTFILAVQNFVLINVAHVLAIGIGAVIRLF